MLTVEKTTPIPVLNLLLTFPQYNNPPGSWFMGLPTLRVSTLLLLGLWGYPPFGSQPYSSVYGPTHPSGLNPTPPAASTAFYTSPAVLRNTSINISNI
jgi:hypothetical protein